MKGIKIDWVASIVLSILATLVLNALFGPLGFVLLLAGGLAWWLWASRTPRAVRGRARVKSLFNCGRNYLDSVERPSRNTHRQRERRSVHRYRSLLPMAFAMVTAGTIVATTACNETSKKKSEVIDLAPEAEEDVVIQEVPKCPADPLPDKSELAKVCQTFDYNWATQECELFPVDDGRTCFSGCDGLKGTCGLDAGGQAACLVEGISFKTSDAALTWQAANLAPEEDPCMAYTCDGKEWHANSLCGEDQTPVATESGCTCTPANPVKIELDQLEGALHSEMKVVFVELDMGYGVVIRRTVLSGGSGAGNQGNGTIELISWAGEDVQVYNAIWTPPECDAHDPILVELKGSPKDHLGAIAWVESCPGQPDNLRMTIVSYTPGFAALDLVTPPFTVDVPWILPWTKPQVIRNLTAASISFNLIPIAYEAGDSETNTPLHLFVCKYDSPRESEKLKVECGSLWQAQRAGDMPLLVPLQPGSFELLYAAPEDGTLQVQSHRYDLNLENFVSRPPVPFTYSNSALVVDRIDGNFSEFDEYTTFSAQSSNLLKIGYYKLDEENKMADSFVMTVGEFPGLAVPTVQQASNKFFFSYLRNKGGYLHPFVRSSDMALAELSPEKALSNLDAHTVSPTIKIITTMSGWAVSTAGILTDNPDTSGTAVDQGAFVGKAFIWPAVY
jgi:hypothetical protein